MYRFLSAVYLSPPSRDLLQQLLERNFLVDLSTLFSSRPVAELESFASTTDPERDLKVLKQEYMDLFAVPTGRYVVPFEDAYRAGTEEGKPEGPLLGGWAIAVIRLYREAGATLDSTCTELPTHVGVELSFMSFLCQCEVNTLRVLHERSEDAEQIPSDCATYRALQTRFLRDHLGEWFPRLSQVIQAHARSPLYSGLALVSEEFLSQDLDHLLAQAD